MQAVCGAKNMEIWVIVIQIAYDLLDTCEIEDEICHICTLHWGYPYAEGDFPRCSICWQKMKRKRKQTSFREASLLGVAEKKKVEDLQRDHVKQSNAAWEINFMFV